jgi:hypothetical protein
MPSPTPAGEAAASDGTAPAASRLQSRRWRSHLLAQVSQRPAGPTQLAVKRKVRVGPSRNRCAHDPHRLRHSLLEKEEANCEADCSFRAGDFVAAQHDSLPSTTYGDRHGPSQDSLGGSGPFGGTRGKRERKGKGREWELPRCPLRWPPQILPMEHHQRQRQRQHYYACMRIPSPPLVDALHGDAAGRYCGRQQMLQNPALRTSRGRISAPSWP